MRLVASGNVSLYVSLSARRRLGQLAGAGDIGDALLDAAGHPLKSPSRQVAA
jgi:hypothetical protein